MSFLLDEEQTWVQRDFGLDRRLIKALSKIGFIYPTLVQARCIPIAMEGKDVLVKARTGSGKTAAFALPLLHKVLTDKEADRDCAAPSIRSLILVPTKELCHQIEAELTKLTFYCRDVVSLCSVTDESASAQSFRLQKQPDIIVSTPAKIVQYIKKGVVSLESVKTLVMDEADLILSFGYAEDVDFITKSLPKIFQGLLTSATLSPELDKFKRVALHSPVILKLEEEGGALGHLLQFYLSSSESDKFLVLYVFIKLGLLQGKGLVFVNDVNRCYKLKLFLQQFYISAAVLNSELPVNSRQHILDEFNRGVFDYLIATDASIEGRKEDNDSDDDNEDEGSDEQDSNDDDEDDEDEEDDEDDEEVDEEAVHSKTKKALESSKKSKKSAEHSDEDGDEGYGVARGIDFQGVNFVINFDFPVSASAYIHRIGRTARGGATGTALSFVTTLPTVVTSINGAERDVAARDNQVLRQVQSQQPWIGANSADTNLAAIQQDGVISDESRMQPAPLQFNMKELDTFRYRVEDVLRGVTAASVKEFRTAELKREILNSLKLKSFFAENPTDLKVLRHDQSAARPIKQKHHLKHVPNYLVPTSMQSAVDASATSSKGKKRKSVPFEKRILKSKKKDPLRSSSSNSRKRR